MHQNVLRLKLCIDYTHNTNWSKIKNCGNTSLSHKEWTYWQPYNFINCNNRFTFMHINYK